jgi:eukaryotic-like serine/threonine-protein kinase
LPLQAGIHLGPYEVLAPLGAGGMGEVYRTRDPRLERDVAVKVLPSALSADPERLARFGQEARAAAALNHPNILAVYDIGQHEGSPYIVSELLEGETLRERMTSGALPHRKALEVAIQIAHGLAAAHETGIVHRDLKPENIFLTGNGHVKILDFGLAKLTQVEPASSVLTALPTSPPNTLPGVVLGTAGYMAPEQVRGLAADSRSDIFAFGAILYEMLSGARAFRGDTVIDAMTAILKDDPPDLPAERRIPPALSRIVDRALEKHPRARFQTASDLAFALEALSSHTEPSEIAGVIGTDRRRQSRERVAWMIFAAALLLLVAATGLYLMRPSGDVRVYRMSIPPPLDARLPPVNAGGGSPAGNFAISPDGRRLVFAALGPDNRRQFWLRSLDALTPQPLAGSDDGRAPFWSPDSRSIAFFAQGKLKKIDTFGGAPSTVCDVPPSEDSGATGSGGGTWNGDNTILFSMTSNVIFKVPASGGVPVPVTTLDKQRGETWHNWPFFLPDGRHFLHLALGSTTGGVNQANGVYVASLDSTEKTLLIPGGSNAMYTPGYLLYMSNDSLMARPFDAKGFALTGEAVSLAEGVALGGSSGRNGAFSVSQNGVLAYQTATGPIRSELVWFDRQGRRIGTIGERADYGDFELSPDGTRVAVSVLVPGRNTRDLWIYDVARDVRLRMTVDPANDTAPVWSPDGATIVFSTNRDKTAGLFQKASTGIEAEHSILQSDHDLRPWSWSHDGRFVLYSADDAPPANLDLLLLPLFGDRKPMPFLATPFGEARARFSPDDRWVAYTSNEGQRPGVYVAPFPKADRIYPISPRGGSWPHWRQDGKRIFYLGEDNMLMNAEVNGEASTFSVVGVTPLFKIDPRQGPRYPYDVTPDGERFLVNTPVEQPESPPIAVVVNWMAALKN